MSVSFPTSLDTLTNPQTTDALNSPSHVTQHGNANDAVEALEAKVGADSSTVTTSHDYKLTPRIITLTYGASTDIDLSKRGIYNLTLDGNTTLTVSNETAGQVFVLRLIQDATGSRTVTWFSTINWANGIEPTLTTTASGVDVFGFICTATDTYDGFIIGQDCTTA